MSVLLQEMTWPEVDALAKRGAVLLLPCGSIEQHGPHLPLGTDVLCIVEIAKRVAAQVDSAIAPPLHYGYKSRPLSGGGQGFVGTTSLQGITYIEVVRDVIGEYLRHGFMRIAVLNWHMENSAFIYEGVDLAVRGALATLAGAPPHVLVITDTWPAFTDDEMAVLFPDGDFPGWDVEHAAVVETSVMLHLLPELVRMDRAVDDRSEEHPPYEIVPAPARLLTKSGVLWRATQATEQKGRLVSKRIVEHLVAVLRKEFSAD